MLKARIIPCLDVEGGRVVKGVNFVDLIDAGDPVEQARVYDKAGADELTFLDITASVENRDTIFDVVNRTAEQCFMQLTVGGVVRTTDEIGKRLLAGAVKASILPLIVMIATSLTCLSRISIAHYSSCELVGFSIFSRTRRLA